MLISLGELCKHLNISEATGRNWLRSGRLTPDPEAHGSLLFSTSYAEAVRAELESESGTSLRSRRNKTYASGRRTYRSYLGSDISSYESVSASVRHLDSYLTGHARDAADCVPAIAVIADCAVQLILQRFADTRLPGLSEYAGDSCYISGFLQGRISLGGYDFLVEDLVGNMRDDVLSLADSHPELFAVSYVYKETSDILGLLYLSISALDKRKSRGAYYTPSHVAGHMCSVLFEAASLEGKTIIDPCAGTGSFLLQLPSEFSPDFIYGNELDEMSVRILRINIALKYGIYDRTYLYSHFICGNFLTSDTSMTFDYIIGNPPWGAAFSDDERSWLAGNYRCASDRRPESGVLAAEKAIRCLKLGGLLSFILPEALLNVRAHRNIREFICESCTLSYLEFLGEVFDGVQCPSVILTLRKKNYVNYSSDERTALSCMGAHIVSHGGAFTIASERHITPEVFSLYASDEEYAVCQRLCTGGSICHLSGHADFALGIVTGDNKRFVSSDMADGLEPVLTGRDIHRYRCDPPSHFIRYSPELFQQVAPESLYRAPEKLLYRFIGGKLTFAYDSSGALSLNSCNILIPRLDGMDIKYVLAVLNSSAAQFYFDKTFHSVKLLRSHIEQIPIPAAGEKEQRRITELVDKLLNQPEESSRTDRLCRDIDLAVARLYGLTGEDYQMLAHLR